MLLGKLSQRNIFLILVHVFSFNDINQRRLFEKRTQRKNEKEKKKESKTEREGSREGEGKEKERKCWRKKKMQENEREEEMTLMPFRQSSVSFRKSLLILFILFSYSQCLALSYEHL